MGILRQRLVQQLKLFLHALLDGCDEALCVLGLLECLVVARAFLLEVQWQVVVGIAVAIGIDHPDLLATQLLTELLQNVDLVVDAVDPLVTLQVLLQDQLAPDPAHQTLDRSAGIDGNKPLPVILMLAEPVNGFDDRPMRGVVGAKFQRFEQ